MWSDQETTLDCLGFETYVESLAGVCLDDDIAPLTLGVFGSWGSGKTSLMKMLEARVNRAQKVKSVWTNAWRYEGKEEMQSALVHAILSSVTKDKTLTDEVKDLLARIKRGTSALKLGKFLGKSLLTMTPDVGGLIDCFEEESQKLAETMAQFEHDFGLLLRETDLERIVVFIDDLDRCQSEKVVETFETIKLFLDMPQCTFVIGADPGKIEHAIKEHYKLELGSFESSSGDRGFADDYIEKIVQIPFRIPEQTLPNIACYVGMLVLQKELTAEAWGTLIKSRKSIMADANGVHAGLSVWIRGQAGKAFRRGAKHHAQTALQRTQPFVSILAHGLRGNPRQIKRFLNILELRQLLAVSNELDVDEGVLVKTLILEYTWGSFFAELAKNCDPDDGRSELLAECRRFRKKEFDVSDSPTLAKAVELPGLQQFLAQKPLLENIDLRPYLFLAQTALQIPMPALSPPEETARTLVEAIMQADRIPSRAAARETARLEPAIAMAVARSLAVKLHTDTSATAQVNVVNAFRVIGHRHPAILPVAMNSLRDMDPAKNKALAVVVNPLLELAEQKQIDVRELRDKFSQSSPVAAALEGGKKRSSRTKPRESS